MSGQALVDEARNWGKSAKSRNFGLVMNDLADALERAEQKSAELAAVIAEARADEIHIEAVDSQQWRVAFEKVVRILSAVPADALSAYTTRPGHDANCEGDFGEWGRQESPCRCLQRETQDCPHDDFVSRSVGAELISECLDCGEVVQLWPEPEGGTNA